MLKNLKKYKIKNIILTNIFCLIISGALAISYIIFMFSFFLFIAIKKINLNILNSNINISILYYTLGFIFIVIPGSLLNYLILRKSSNSIKFISLNIYIIICSTLFFIIVKPYAFPPFKMTQAGWKNAPLNPGPYLNAYDCHSESIRWKNVAYEGSNCRTFIDEWGNNTKQLMPLKLSKNGQEIWSSGHNIRNFQIFNCTNSICFIGLTSDRPTDLEILAMTPDNSDLTVILWPEQKQTIYSSPCRPSPRIANLQINQINLNKFNISVVCDGIVTNKTYQTEINTDNL